MDHMPWDQRAGESDDDYARFLVYRDLGPRRSLARAASQCGLSEARLKQLSSQWKWPSRAISWDHFDARDRRQEEMRQLRESRLRQRNEAADWQRVAGAQMAAWVRRGPSGELELVRELSPSEAIRLWKVGYEAERMLRGYPNASAARGSTPEQELYIQTMDQGEFALEAARVVARELERFDAKPGTSSALEEDVTDLIRAWLLARIAEARAAREGDEAPPEPWEDGHIEWPLQPWDLPFSEA